MIALSYSRISDFRSCPFKFYLKYITKHPCFKNEADNPAFIYGTNVHKQLENYVIKLNAGENNIPISSLVAVEQTKPLIDNLRQRYRLEPELQIAIDKDFNRVDWFDKKAWFRVIYDFIGVAHDILLGDYKTGKMYDYEGSMEIPGQLHLSSLVGMALYPNIEKVQSMYIYVDQKKVIKFSLDRGQFDELKKALIDEHTLINDTTEWCQKKNKWCGWCPVPKTECKYSKN